MQIIKQKIEKRILSAARGEFLKLGFNLASMRNIAKKARITTSNIYNYFKNKDEIFIRILLPTVLYLNEPLTAKVEPKNLETLKEWDIEVFQQKLKLIIEYIKIHHEDLELLLFKSSGSSLENFRDELIDKYTNLFIGIINQYKKENSEINVDLSYYTIRRLASFFVNSVSDIIRYRLSEKEMAKFLNEISVFYYFGFFQNLLNFKK